jgi:hypothetical protein
MTFPKNASGRDCVRAWDTMPWVLQNSATHEQGEWLKDHLAHCESCSAEFAQQTRLQRALSLPSDIPLDANAGLKRLLGRLDTADAHEESYRMRSGTWLSRALVAVVLIQALGIGTLGMKLWSTGNSPAYRTLSQEPVPATASGAIRIVPDATMTVASLNALLHTLRLQVVGGPNEVGAYTVAPMGSASAAHTLQQLRATQGIRLAEPVAVTP